MPCIGLLRCIYYHYCPLCSALNFIKFNPPVFSYHTLRTAHRKTVSTSEQKVFQMVCSNTKGSVTADALEAQTTSLQASLFSSVSPQTIANLVFTAHKKLNENAPPPPADAPPPARPTAITSYGYAVLAAAVAKLGPLDKFRFYFGMIAGGDEATPELLEVRNDRAIFFWGGGHRGSIPQASPPPHPCPSTMHPFTTTPLFFWSAADVTKCTH